MRLASLRRFATGDSTSESALLEESDESPARFRFERVVADLVVAEALRVDRVARTGAAFSLFFSRALFFLVSAKRFFFASASFFCCAADFWYLRRCVLTAASGFSFLVVAAPFSSPLALREGAAGPAAAAAGRGGGTNGRERTEFRARVPGMKDSRSTGVGGRRGVARRTYRHASL
jgi:hypothetical protein